MDFISFLYNLFLFLLLSLNHLLTVVLYYHTGISLCV